MGREIPIMMSGPLVRATLEGAKPEYARSYPAKTQTRRPIKPQPGPDIVDFEYDPDADLWLGNTQEDNDLGYCSSWSARIGGPGDVLWVRETCAIDHPCVDPETGNVDDLRQPKGIPKDSENGWWKAWYRASYTGDDTKDDRGFDWTPAIHMPRWACRLRLPLVKVRIERVQSISEADAWAEGYGEHWQRRVKEAGADGPLGRPDARGWFAMLWDKLYGTWGQNPWVAVYEWGQIEVSR